MCVWKTRQPVGASSPRSALCNEGQVAATDWTYRQTDRQSSDRITLRARTAGREKKGGLEVCVSKVHMVGNVHRAAGSKGAACEEEFPLICRRFISLGRGLKTRAEGFTARL